MESIPNTKGPPLRAALTWCFMVGTAGLEPATSASRTLRATKLRYVPIVGDVRPNHRVLDMALPLPAH